MLSTLQKWPVEYNSDQTLHFQRIEWYPRETCYSTYKCDNWILCTLQLRNILSHSASITTTASSPCLTAEELHPAILPLPISLCNERQHYLSWHLQEKTGNCMWRTEYVKEKKSPSLTPTSPKELRGEKETQQILCYLTTVPLGESRCPQGDMPQIMPGNQTHEIRGAELLWSYKSSIWKYLAMHGNPWALCGC